MFVRAESKQRFGEAKIEAWSDAAWEQAAQHSRRSGDERGWSAALVWLASSAHTGPAPVEDFAFTPCVPTRASAGATA